MAKAKRQPRGLGRSAAATEDITASQDDKKTGVRFNPLSGEQKEKSSKQDETGTATTAESESTPLEDQEETASLALKEGEAGDELAELRQTYEAAQKQFAETGAQEYLRGTIHECDRMLRNCGEEVYPSSEFNYIYASALHDFSLIGAEPEELNGFVELALEHVSHAADLLEGETAGTKEWKWKYYLVAGKVYLQKVLMSNSSG